MEKLSLNQVFRSAARKMLNDFESTRGISHNPTKGSAREYIVMESFLRPYLPLRYSIGSGIIIDANNKESRQQDLVIYDQFFSPILLNFESDRIFFSESVFAVFEVKSHLGKKELKDMIQKSASVWNLSKTSTTYIELSPNVSIPNLISPTLCVGICFESSLSIINIPSIINESRSFINNGHALSIVCILKDKDGKSGVVVNMKYNDLTKIELIPTQSSRLARVNCDSEGDALLYTYLLIMEHLKHSGAITSGPDLIKYVEASGFGGGNITIPKEEIIGGSFTSDGKTIEVNTVYRMSELLQKVMKTRDATDEEILELFYYFPQLPIGESILNPKSKFYTDGSLLDFPSPAVVYQSIIRHSKKVSSLDDEKLLLRFVELIRGIGHQYQTLDFGFYNNPK
jgi:hypothetical protein